VLVVAEGEKVSLKRKPGSPAPAHFVSARGAGVQNLTPIRYVLLV